MSNTAFHEMLEHSYNAMTKITRPKPPKGKNKRAIFDEPIFGKNETLPSMRKVILAKIEELKEQHNGFAKNHNQWLSAITYVGPTRERKHISKVDVDELTDEDLLIYFSRVIQRLSQQNIFQANL